MKCYDVSSAEKKNKQGVRLLDSECCLHALVCIRSPSSSSSAFLSPSPSLTLAKESKAVFNCRVQKVWSWTNEHGNQSGDFFFKLEDVQRLGWEGGLKLRSLASRSHFG